MPILYEQINGKPTATSIGSSLTGIVLRNNGALVVATDLDPTQAVGSSTISAVRLLRQTAGSSGSTIIDVHKNGTTIFTTQANRPSVTSAAGNNATDSKAPDDTSLSDGDILTLDIDQVEGGSPDTVTVQIIV